MRFAKVKMLKWKKLAAQSRAKSLALMWGNSSKYRNSLSNPPIELQSQIGTEKKSLKNSMKIEFHWYDCERPTAVLKFSFNFVHKAESPNPAYEFVTVLTRQRCGNPTVQQQIMSHENEWILINVMCKLQLKTHEHVHMSMCSEWKERKAFSSPSDGKFSGFLKKRCRNICISYYKTSRTAKVVADYEKLFLALRQICAFAHNEILWTQLRWQHQWKSEWTKRRSEWIYESVKA